MLDDCKPNCVVVMVKSLKLKLYHNVYWHDKRLFNEKKIKEIKLFFIKSVFKFSNSIISFFTE